MKTTIDIASNILERCRHLARANKTTLKNLVEEGLLIVLTQARASQPPKVSPVVFNGQGLHPEFVDVSWEKVRTAVYEGHGA